MTSQRTHGRGSIATASPTLVIELDHDCGVPCDKFRAALRQLAGTAPIRVGERRLRGRKLAPVMNAQEEFRRLEAVARDADPAVCVYVTDRQFSDRYYYHADKNLGIVSLADWTVLSSATRDVGALFLIARILLDGPPDLDRHAVRTGCARDTLKSKAVIDTVMGAGRLCSDCRERFAISSPPIFTALLPTAEAIVRAVARGVRTGIGIAAGDALPDWEAFEERVADAYRACGAQVQRNVEIAGFQIDVVATERLRSGVDVRTAVECKHLGRPVNSREIARFAQVLTTLRQAGAVDVGVMVSSSGFSVNARETAAQLGVRTLVLNDLVPVGS
jgi:hypothetical protein